MLRLLPKTKYYESYKTASIILYQAKKMCTE